MTEDAPRVERLGIPYDLLCQQCGYNLRGLTGLVCPECGRDLDEALAQESRIPWVHRDRIGRSRAFWKTVVWVSFQYPRFCEEIVRPVDFKSAVRFRRAVVAHAAAAAMLAIWIYYAWNESRVTSLGLSPNQRFSLWVPAIASLFTVLLLLVNTGLPSYFFDVTDISIQRRNSSVAMSYYTCGALAWWLPLFLLALGGIALIQLRQDTGLWLVFFFVSLIPVAVLDWWFNLVRTVRRIMPNRRSRGMWIGVTMPFLFFLVGPMIVGLPFVVVLYLLIALGGLPSVVG